MKPQVRGYFLADRNLPLDTGKTRKSPLDLARIWHDRCGRNQSDRYEVGGPVEMVSWTVDPITTSDPAGGNSLTTSPAGTVVLG